MFDKIIWAIFLFAGGVFFTWNLFKGNNFFHPLMPQILRETVPIAWFYAGFVVIASIAVDLFLPHLMGNIPIGIVFIALLVIIVPAWMTTKTLGYFFILSNNKTRPMRRV